MQSAQSTSWSKRFLWHVLWCDKSSVRCKVVQGNVSAVLCCAVLCCAVLCCAQCIANGQLSDSPSLGPAAAGRWRHT
jgi:hypothetical protein